MAALTSPPAWRYLLWSPVTSSSLIWTSNWWSFSSSTLTLSRLNTDIRPQSRSQSPSYPSSEASLLEFLMSSISSRTATYSQSIYPDFSPAKPSQLILLYFFSGVWSLLSGCPVQTREYPACQVSGLERRQSLTLSPLVPKLLTEIHRLAVNVRSCINLAHYNLVIFIFLPLNLPKASLVVIGRISTLSSESAEVNICWSASGRSEVSYTSISCQVTMNIITTSRGPASCNHLDFEVRHLNRRFVTHL